MVSLAIVGGQYGSEGKGVIAAHIARQMCTAGVRTGGPNAGHSLIEDGRVWKMRQVPCAWVNPRARLLIGPAAVIDPDVLVSEVDALEGAGHVIRARLSVDPHAILVNEGDRHHEQDHHFGERISSTLEGVGQARIRRIWRDPEYVDSLDLLKRHDIRVAGTVAVANLHASNGMLMLEGTQGFGLSLIHGEWPYVTSHDTTAAQLYADAGVSWSYPGHVLVVLRAFPIRVGGNSGPLFGEMTWAQMSKQLGKPVEERTTVTNKVRRIGRFDWDLAARAIVVNGADSLALTFADYIDPSVEGATSWDQLTPPVIRFIEKMEKMFRVPVLFVGTGGPTWAVIERTFEGLFGGDTGERKDHLILTH